MGMLRDFRLNPRLAAEQYQSIATAVKEDERTIWQFIGVTNPSQPQIRTKWRMAEVGDRIMELMGRLELPTCSLRVSCSTN